MAGRVEEVCARPFGDGFYVALGDAILMMSTNSTEREVLVLRCTSVMESLQHEDFVVCVVFVDDDGMFVGMLFECKFAGKSFVGCGRELCQGSLFCMCSRVFPDRRMSRDNHGWRRCGGWLRCRCQVNGGCVKGQWRLWCLLMLQLVLGLVFVGCVGDGEPLRRGMLDT